MSIFSPSRYICIKWESDGVKFKDLALKLSMDGATLTGILDRLERQGFVIRADDPEDRRSVLVFLAEKAKMHRDEFCRLAETLDDEIRHQFNSEDFTTFSRMLDQIGKT
ncbi:MAG: MarR family transcriptional regulator [Desulfosporosinus sp.]|nr:MarR family transcriptional regulator [Desulfosporosinus sp.]